MAAIRTFTKTQTPGYVRIESDWADITADTVNISWTGHDDMRGFQIGVQMADGAVGTPGTFGVATSGTFEVNLGHAETLESLDEQLQDAGSINAATPVILRQAAHSFRRIQTVRSAVVAGTMTQFRVVATLYPS
jgi:hypothetical protein